MMVDAAKRLTAAGAQLLVIASNTSHKCAPALENAAAAGLALPPLLHIADATVDAIVREGNAEKTIGLIGSRYTMEEAWYRGRLEQRGINVVIPDESDRVVVHKCIYEEIAAGKGDEASTKSKLVAIITKLVAGGAEAIILGCTELGALIKPGDVPIPLYDTTTLHAHAVVEASFALAPEKVGTLDVGASTSMFDYSTAGGIGVDVGESAVFGLGAHVRISGDANLADSGDVFEDIVDELPGTPRDDAAT